MKKKVTIEVLRIWFTICVCLHHFHMYSESLPYGGGYLAVDFFYILSGFYLFSHFAGEKNNKFSLQDILAYIKKRYTRLWFIYIWSFVVTLCIRWVLGLRYTNTSLYMRIQELFMLEFSIVPTSVRVNPPDWYCGYLFLATIFVYVLLCLRKKAIYIIMGIAAGVTYIWLFWKVGYLNIFPNDSFKYSMIFGRAFAGIVLGIGIYPVTKKIAKHRNNKILINLLTIIMLFITGYMLLWNTAYSRTDFLILVVFAIIIVCCETMDEKEQEGIIKRGIFFGGKISYVVFLNHYIVAECFSSYNLLRSYDWKVTSIVYLLIVFGFSLLQYFIFSVFKNSIGKVSEKIKDRKGIYAKTNKGSTYNHN